MSRSRSLTMKPLLPALEHFRSLSPQPTSHAQPYLPQPKQPSVTHTLSWASTDHTISTIVGSPTGGLSGDGGAASRAQLHYPWGLTQDSLGNLYIGDAHNHRLRKVSAVTNIISTFAGTGKSSYCGDDGPAMLACLSSPLAVWMSSANALYFVDHGNLRIRVVSSSGSISTVAGNGDAGFLGDNGPATSATLWSPYWVTGDSTGALYIADSLNHRIRMVSKEGIISTFAGTGATNGPIGDGGAATSAMLNTPMSVFVTNTGTVFITERYGNRVRRVKQGIISTVAGSANGTSGSTGDGGSATSALLNGPYCVTVNALTEDIVIADTFNDKVRVINSFTGIISALAGTGVVGSGEDNIAATSSALFRPLGLLFDNDQQSLLVTDWYNHRVRRISPIAPTHLVELI